MDFTSIRIKNFKAIHDTTLSGIGKFNVIVGTNGSGKSSALQALHWILQSGRNPKVKTGGATLSLADADYMPSPQYKNSSYSGEFGNFRDAPKMEVSMRTQDEDGNDIDADLWIKAARNEGISVHIPPSNSITTHIRDRNREISAYIPGLAGIPLIEAKLSKRVVHRQAAAGDANTVLRNLLYLLKSSSVGAKHGASQLDDVLHWVSKVLGQLSLKVDFDDEKDFSIRATFKTGDMERNGQPDKPLELAGIGFLQVIQIFAYLIYYRPQLLLVDEPDSHLHPNRQEDLVRVLYDAAQEYDCQVIMTTHSPSVVRAMPPDAKLIWMKEGQVVEDLEGARALMGWGLLDKTVLLLSEDKNTDMLRKIIAQWPEIDRKVAVWPLAGIRTLPSAGSLQGMNAVFGDALKIAMHRDGDFLTADERVRWSQPYVDKGIAVWITEGSDVEAYFGSVDILRAYGCQEPDIKLAAAIGEIGNWESTFRDKRNEINGNEIIYPGRAGTPTNDIVIGELCAENPAGKYVGKTLIKKIRKVLQDDHVEGASSFGKRILDNHEIAPDLKEFLEGLLR
jgi:ABC-type cobalamin/Fe3+-siderophores transport system ATPase subunit